ncbi:MAG TPA: STAS domain-containing protein [Cyclobacteriaceae bacterium]|jgi:anti-sigma B factor antagonist
MINLTHKIEGAIYIISVVGDVDASSSIQLDNALGQALEDNQTKILVDCSKLNYISSAGLGVFMSYIQDFENKNIKLVLCNLNEKVIGVFRILGLDQLLKIVDTIEEGKKLIDEL